MFRNLEDMSGKASPMCERQSVHGAEKNLLKEGV
jgi:hypothetical protein